MLSLLRGVIPVSVELVTVVALVYTIGQGWRARWLALAAVVGVATGVAVHWYYGTLGLASEPPPWHLWLWGGLRGFAIAVAVAGWRGAGWWRRNVAVFAASFCLFAPGLTIHCWVGRFPTVSSAWG